ncbi:Beta-lactam-inducible penicillin-binding protein [Paraliobacillus sp. PM-2]|uniref:penicillin-binding transpeptidase domain-containing protein n=1 Tax=Paraliobacillus sp. PM-2 TaxID=1462524 RepID=UPI00061BF39B|nr:penicillin-binding transpeptidase domain-containing protein [Paraliobacillus sp. PM-2]CQR46385.1 Beta-lactam-inducible penicillin-binding protein [Paraliobacillus sp. PM-2]
MKRFFLLGSLLCLLIGLVACSNEEETAEDRIQDYVDYWTEKNFSEMYKMIGDKEAYPKEVFVDRYQKIYNDLEVTDISITYRVPETTEEEEPNSFPLEVSMNTIAGEVNFEAEMALTEKKVEDETKWYIKWHPGFIFPSLKDGAEVGVQTTAPERGEIYDRNQNGLAINATIYSVGVQPGRFEQKEEEKQQIADLLDISVEAIDKALSPGWVNENTFVPLKDMPTTIDEEYKQKLFAIPSVVKKDITGRTYPYSEATAHLVGYIGQITAEELKAQKKGTYSQNDQIGKRGLEQLFESRLKGENGVAIVAESENGDSTVIAEKQVQDGEDITVTIDANIQQTIYNSFDEDAGTATAINPKTGETLALVSSPAFDPNELTYGISQSKWEAIQNDEQTPLTNRFAATFSPGSAIKPIIGAIGLQNGSIKNGEGIDINGKTWSKDAWGNYAVRRVSTSSNPVDLTDALIRSDNIYFAKKAIEMDSDAFVAGLESFGFGQELPFTYPIQDSSISSTGSIDKEILLADSGYGQGQLQVSALHLATAFTTFLNDGDMLQPTLELDEENSVTWQEGLLSSEDTQVIKQALRQVVTASNGTAPEANIDTVQLSGKTGTAELKSSQEDTKGQENGWFVAYPEDESMILSMMVEHVEDKGGSHYTVEKVANIFNQLY